MGVDRESRSHLGSGIALGAILTLVAGWGLTELGPLSVGWGDDETRIVQEVGGGGDSNSGDGTGDLPPEEPADFVSTYQEVSDGVVRLSVETCDGGGTGSGALVAEDLVITAAHVVDDYSSVQLQLGDQAVVGTVIGFSEGEDLALVRANRPLRGHVFEVHAETPPVGTDIVALGYPLSGPLSFAGPGSISTHGEVIHYAGEGEELIEVGDVMRISTPTNNGNSGGPLIDEQGRIAGIVSGGDYSFGEIGEDGRVRVSLVLGYGWGVPSGTIHERVDQWSETPEPLLPDECALEQPEPESTPVDLVTNLSDGPEAALVSAVFLDYFDGINRSDYERAYRQLSDDRQAEETLEQFTDGQSTSIAYEVVLLETREEGEDLRVQVTFRSIQDAEHGPEGWECAYWTLEYQLVPGGEHGWAIETAAGQDPDRPAEACT